MLIRNARVRASTGDGVDVRITAGRIGEREPGLRPVASEDEIDAAVDGVGGEQAGMERDADGRATGRLWRMGHWLADRVPASPAALAAGLAAVSAQAAAHGVTGFTDATPGATALDVAGLAGGQAVQRRAGQDHAGRRDAAAARLARRLGPAGTRGLTVVSQPHLMAARGEQYARDVPPEDLPDLRRLALESSSYGCRGFLNRVSWAMVARREPAAL